MTLSKNVVSCTSVSGEIVSVPVNELTFRPAAYALIVRDNKMLLISTKTTGKWFFPGGKVELGESLEETLSREVHEETGVTIANIRFLYFKEGLFYYNQGYQSFSFAHTAEFVSEDLVANNPDAEDEAEHFEWVDIASLSPEVMQSFAWEIIEKFLKKQ